MKLYSYLLFSVLACSSAIFTMEKESSTNSQVEKTQTSLFSNLLEKGEFDKALQIFLNASETARLTCIQTIIANFNSNPFEARILSCMICNSNPQYKKFFENAGISITQSVRQVCDNEPALLHAKEFNSIPDLAHIFPQVTSNEQELEANYYTFVHAQSSAYYFFEKLYTFLWQIRKKQTLYNFIFPHVKGLTALAEDILYEKLQRNFLLANGKYDDESSKFLLFMNYALFSNCLNPGSNTAYYISTNDNASAINLSIIDPFKNLGYEHIYHKFKHELVMLNWAYQNRFGNLLFIAIPKEKIHKYAFVAGPYGYKKMVWIAGIGETSDIKIIMETLKNNPEKISNISDQQMLEFCLVMTQKKGGLDPNTGIKILPILSGNQEKLKELQLREETLFAKIKAAIEQEEQNRAHGNAIQRAHAVLNHIVPTNNVAQPVVLTNAMARIQNTLGHLQ